jgi:hypothetical protein
MEVRQIETGFSVKIYHKFWLDFCFGCFQAVFFLFVCTILAFAIVEITDRGMKLEK